MKLSPLIALPVSLALAACAADPSDVEDPPPAEDVAESRSELRIDSTKYCLPGEVVKCSLGPPPVCWCEPIVASPIVVAR